MAAEINKALEKFYNGDPLNNADLVMLHDHTLKTAELLSHMGKTFRLACNEALHVRDACAGYIRFRQERDDIAKRHKQALRRVK
jgi:hypothetical protein